MKEYYVLSSWVKACLQGFCFSGFDNDAILQCAGLDHETFAAPYCNSSELFALFAAAEDLYGEPAGLAARLGITPTCFSSASLACLAADNLQAGLKIMAQYHPIITNGYQAHFLCDNQGGEFRFYLDRHLVLPDRVADAVLATVIRTVRFIQPRIQSVVQVDFARPRPSDVRMYDHYFKAPLVWDASRFAVHLSAESLFAPSMHSHPELLTQHLNDCDKKLHMIASKSLVNSAKYQIRILLSEHPPTIEDVARAMSISVRSLQRALKKENTCFKTLYDEVRKVEALHLLKNTDHSITHIAHTLGFSDSGNFARAFKRWHQCSPLQYRHLQTEPLHFQNNLSISQAS